MFNSVLSFNRNRKRPNLKTLLFIFIFGILFTSFTLLLSTTSHQQFTPIPPLKPSKCTPDNSYCFQPNQLNHLIIVAGHSIFTGYDYSKYEQESEWALDDFQHGTVSAFIKHIDVGITEASNDDKSLLIFSGGQTRYSAGPRSEASSYWNIANAKQWLGSNNVKIRSDVEEYARDSFENLVFSICRFYQLTGEYPTFITVVGFEFKRQRFVEFHREAIKFPIDRFKYIGINAPGQEIEEAVKNENKNALVPFKSDSYGCSGVLIEKKLSRDMFYRNHPYSDVSRMNGLLNACNIKNEGINVPWMDGKEGKWFKMKGG